MRWLGPVLMILALIVVIASGAEDGASIPALLLGAAGLCAWHRSTKKSAAPLADPPRDQLSECVA